MGLRKQWATQRLVTTLKYVPSGPDQRKVPLLVLPWFEADGDSMAAFRISKHPTFKGERPDTQDPERLPKNESLDPASVGGPAQGKVPVTALFCRTRLIGNSLVAFKIRKIIIEKGDTLGPQDAQSSSEPESLDPSLVDEWKVTNGTAIRFLMRRVPHSVAVITSNMPRHNPPESFRGMTVSSFNTVCLEPKVIVSFNIKLPSATYDAIQACGQFNVYLMNSTCQGAAIAELFATGRGRETFKNVYQRNDDSEVVSSTLSNEELTEREPDLLRSNNVMFTLQCKLMDQTLKVADHVIVLGEVLTHRLPPVVQTWDRMSLGMCYVNRLYRRPGRVQLLPGERARVNSATGATASVTSLPSTLEDGSSDEDEDEDDTIPFVY